jgi:hypothetical protein
MAIRLNYLDLDPRKKKAYEALSSMKYIDLQKAVIERGIDFEILVNSDYPRLSSYFISHFDAKVDKERPIQFDHWMDLKLQERGYKDKDPVRQFKRFSPVVVEVDYKEAEKKALKEGKKPDRGRVETPKVKKEKDKELNIYTGTRKHYAMKLAETLKEKFSKKYTQKELINKFIGQVMEKINQKFPDSPANEKSVRIWIKRALDATKE